MFGYIIKMPRLHYTRRYHLKTCSDLIASHLTIHPNTVQHCNILTNESPILFLFYQKKRLIYLFISSGSCYENQTVIIKMSSSYGISNMIIARNSSEYAIERTEFVYLYRCNRSFLFYCVNIEY